METGVYGEHGVHVPRRVVVAPGYDLYHVTIQLLLMAAPIAQETSMTRRNAFNQHAHVFILLNTINLSPLKRTIHPE
jgi:hypothetical protein